MAVSEITTQLGMTMPNFSGVLSYIALFGVIILFGGMFILGFILLWNHLKFNKKIEIFSKVGAKLQLVGSDRAMFQRIGYSGDFWCVLKKSKKVLPLPTIQMAKNSYWHFVREDGEWVNFGLGDFDKQMKEAGAYYVHEDMRLQRLGIQKNLRDRLLNQSWWGKYGTTMIFMIFAIFMTILMIIQFREFKTSYSGAHAMAVEIKAMAIQVSNIARSIGGGVIPAG